MSESCSADVPASSGDTPEACSDWSAHDGSALQAFYDTSPRVDWVDTAGIQQALESVSIEGREPPSLWDRLLALYRQFFGEPEVDVPDWLENFDFNPSVLEWIWYALIALVVISAVVILVNEIRHLRSGKRRAEAPAEIASTLPPVEAFSLDDAMSASPDQLPGALLRLLLVSLKERGLLLARVSMTHREIAAAMRDAEHEQSVTVIASAAERATFGGWRPSRLEAGELVATTRELLQNMRRPGS